MRRLINFLANAPFGVPPGYDDAELELGAGKGRFGIVIGVGQK
jgi:hypothetical protein